MRVNPVEPVTSIQRTTGRKPQVWRLDKKRRLYVETSEPFPDLQKGETLRPGEVRRTDNSEWVAIGRK